MRTVKTLVVAGLAAIVAGAFFIGGASAARPRGLVALVKDTTGAQLGVVRIVPLDDGKVVVRIAATGLAPGFHGFHVHTTGICDPAATDAAGNPSPFFTAGGHYNPTTATHGAHAGDMPPLYAAADGSARLRFVTDRFRARDLMDTDGSAVILHAGPDNLAHIPATSSTGGERYHSHLEDVFGADSASKATGDAGARAACGLVKRVTT